MRWTAGTGMQSVEGWLASNGVKVSGVTTDAAYSVNAAGDVVGGQLQNGHAFIARTSAVGKGLIDVQDYNRTLQEVAFAQAQLGKTSDLVLNGLMGSVPHTLLQPSKLRAWVSGDWGQQSRQGNNGQAAAGDFGLAVGITDKLEGQLALGQQYTDSNTLYNGKTSAQQSYVAPGLTYLFPQAHVAVSALGYYADGNVDVSRGYLNAGTPTLSKGSAGTSTTGARLRADWINAYSLGPVGMTPYVSYTWITSKINAYTEAGGSFAAQWNARTDTAQLLRLGQDGEWAVNDQFKLTGRVEYVQRLQQDNQAVTGRIVGLSGFAFDANQKQNDWVRVGLGGEYKLTATSLLRAMLNVTTEKADAPDAWLNLAYEWTF